MRASLAYLAGPVLVAGLLPLSALAEEGVRRADFVTSIVPGLFCAPPEGGRRDAPGTMSGFVHVPDEPVVMFAEGRVAPAALGMGFGVRFTVDAISPVLLDYRVTHPPMQPGNVTEQSWQGFVDPAVGESIFFQFDVPYEMQTGAWTIAAYLGETEVFSVDFTVVPAQQMPDALFQCRGEMLSLIPQDPVAAG